MSIGILSLFNFRKVFLVELVHGGHNLILREAHIPEQQVVHVSIEGPLWRAQVAPHLLAGVLAVKRRLGHRLRVLRDRIDIESVGGVQERGGQMSPHADADWRRGEIVVDESSRADELGAPHSAVPHVDVEPVGGPVRVGVLELEQRLPIARQMRAVHPQRDSEVAREVGRVGQLNVAAVERQR